MPELHLIPLPEILVADRLRLEIIRDMNLKALRESIETKGLFHPVVLIPLDPPQGAHRYRLVAGGRRLSVMEWIYADGGKFLCNRTEIPPGIIPALFLHELSPSDLVAAELEENIFRMNLSWQEEAQGRVKVHKLRQLQNPKQSVRDTAYEIAERQQIQPGLSFKQTQQSLKITQHFDDPAIRNARTPYEAYNLALQKEEAAFRSILVKQRSSIPPTIQLIEGDLLAVLPTLASESIDLIVADPPYAISVGGAGFRSRTMHHHNYDDSEANARAVASAIFTQGFRVSKPRANLFLFCDIHLWPWLQEFGSAAGWVPFRTPVIWAKSDAEGLAPWGKQGFRRTYELIFFATKGQRGLIASPVDILRFDRVARNERDYGAAKPPALIRSLIECSTLVGDTILDPCCGTGASLVAAKESSRKAIGIELDHTAFTLATAKLGSPDIPNPIPEVAEL